MITINLSVILFFIDENFSVKELFENPSLIEDPVLARDVFYVSKF